MLITAVPSLTTILDLNENFSLYKFQFSDTKGFGKFEIKSTKCTSNNKTFQPVQENASYLLDLEQRASIDSFELILHDSDSNLSTDVVLVFGSNNGGKSWIGVKATSKLISPRSAEEQTSVHIRFGHAADWPLVAEDAAGVFVALAALVLASTLFLNRVRLAKRLCASACIVLGSAWLVAAAACVFAGPVQWLAPCCWRGASWLALAAAVGRAEAHLPFAMLGVGLSGLATKVANDCLAFRSCADLAGKPFPLCVALTVAGGGLVATRVGLLARALLRAERDSAAYAAEWLRLARDPAFADDAARLQSVAQRIAERCRGRAARHFNRRTNPADPNVLTGPTPGTVDPARPVTSLDQLYAQAMGAAPVLQRKVAEWSAGLACEQEDQARPAPGAWLPARPRASVMERCVSLGVIKSPSRAMEKAALCYGGDVSRLVDICRARVGFGGPADLSRFLVRVAKDCRVVRIKNMMEAEDGSHPSAGPIRNGYKVPPGPS